MESLLTRVSIFVVRDISILLMRDISMNDLFRTVWLMVFFLLLVLSCNAQSQPTSDTCETVSAKLDSVALEYKQVGTKESVIILIGDTYKERADSIVSILTDATKYLERFHQIDVSLIATGVNRWQTPRTQLRVFVNGKQTTVLDLGRSSRLCFGMGETFK
jgi:hypothetical protein